MSDRFPERLRELIRRAGSQNELSRRSGVSQPLISNWITGGYRPSSMHASKVAAAMAVSVAWLLGQTEDEAPSRRAALDVDLLREVILAVLKLPLRRRPRSSAKAAQLIALVYEEITDQEAAVESVLEPRRKRILKLVGSLSA
jgi:transcriptional regulator with XRE-family HTH domain